MLAARPNDKTWRVAHSLAFMLLAFSSQVAWSQPLWSRVPIVGDSLRWISSTTYVPALDKIGVIDPLQNAVLLISPLGRSEVQDGGQLVNKGESMLPATLTPTHDGFALAMVDRRIYRLGQNLRPLSTNRLLDLSKAASGAPGKIIATYDVVAAGTQFLSFGATKTNDGKLHFGFFRAPVQDPGKFSLLRDNADNRFYLVGHRYLAGTESGREYAVLIGGRSSTVIVEFLRSGRSRLLDVIPSPYRQAPDLRTEMTGAPHSEELTFREIENMSIPVGLYSQDDLLYLLTREPKDNTLGETRWLLFQIEPKTARLIGSMELPTTAHHLSVVATPKMWYFIERGEVQETGEQSIPSMVTIPTAGIKARCLTEECLSQTR